MEADEGNGKEFEFGMILFMTFASIITGYPATRIPIPEKKPNLVGKPGGKGG